MQWILHTNAGLLTRIGVGCAIFLALAIADLRRRGREATRWREYLFLAACVAAALAYGIVNDQITTTISWEYFAFGKGVDESAPNVETNSPAFRIEVAKIGAKATWSAGLIIGVALLLANNPSSRLPQLSYHQLLRHLSTIFAITVAFAAALGLLGYLGLFARVSQDFADMVRLDEWRPRRFMTVYGVHLGGYIGGLAGTIAAVVLIRRRRRVKNTNEIRD